MGGDIRVVELFAGVGGFRLGLEAASDRFKTIWADQWEPGTDKRQFAFRCYDGHFADSGSVDVNVDINDVWADVPEHDLLVGGFPCQDYSVASTNAKGIEGKKGVLWWNIRDIVELRQPRFVLLENVDRILKSPVKQRGRDFAIILRCFHDLGYDVEWRVINAADYGLPQRRRRTFIFARKRSSDSNPAGCPLDDLILSEGFFAGCFPVERSNPSKRAEFDICDGYPTLQDVSDTFSTPLFNSGAMVGSKVLSFECAPVYDGPITTLGDILDSDVGSDYCVEGEALEQWRYMKGSKKLPRTRKDGTTYLYSEGAIPFPDILERAGRTMLTSEGSANRSSHLVLDPSSGKYRTLTPRECERLNGFPDDWTAGYMTEHQRYFCMGNALVVPLVTAMGMRLLELCGHHDLERLPP